MAKDSGVYEGGDRDRKGRQLSRSLFDKKKKSGGCKVTSGSGRVSLTCEVLHHIQPLEKERPKTRAKPLGRRGEAYQYHTGGQMTLPWKEGCLFHRGKNKSVKGGCR